MRFLVHVRIRPDAPQHEIEALQPAEQARFAELVELGFIKNFYLSHTRDEHWSICTADHEDTLREALQTLPFYQYMILEYNELVDE
ncbi:hypothetical protein PTI45_03465 [Paenibacillus nuruki]|uniref:Muconolactone isomerase domain-containing protein n=1 Tax=Paenibacillus nuruki TaxID=1886670 RepID=A0A1E3L0C8_9BACL|nr:muconolactone Delta-isomerase family protein [Paenibacillus nuruki]ODP27144.1 hypothetical protein PTI45_03465 [Paenibacillus nuruki]